MKMEAGVSRCRPEHEAWLPAGGMDMAPPGAAALYGARATRAFHTCIA